MAQEEPDSNVTADGGAEDPNKERLLFLELLRSSEGYQLFYSFLATTFSQQLITFWKEVQEYEKLCEDAAKELCGDENAVQSFAKDGEEKTSAASLKSLPLSDEIKAKARDVHDKYLKVGTPKEINITEVVRKQVSQRVDVITSTAPPFEFEPVCLFNEADKKCIDLMRGNFFLVFRKQTEFITWQQRRESALTNSQKDCNKADCKDNKSAACAIL